MCGRLGPGLTDADVAEVEAVARAHFRSQGMPVDIIPDAVQDVLLAVLSEHSPIRDVRKFAWTAARRIYCNEVRRAVFARQPRQFRTRAPKGHGPGVLASVPKPRIDDNPYDRLWAAQRWRILTMLIAELPPRTREIVQRSYLGNESEASICASLGISVWVLRNEKSRGRLELIGRAHSYLGRGFVR